MEDLIIRAAGDIVKAEYAIALTGAGISTESGISDFRGPQGIWTRNPEAERRALRGYEEFMNDPAGWWERMLSGMPRRESLGDVAGAKPNPGHYALAELEQMGILKFTITQNVDSLHEKAGTKNLLEYHGSMSKLRCVSCNFRIRRDEITMEELIAEWGLPPRCPKCHGLIKSDGVSFGEPIPSDVAEHSLEEAWKCDLMLICGTSAVVYPFANLPRVARQMKNATIIEVNSDPTPLTHERISSYFIQGKTGEILPRIVEAVRRLKAQTG
jgi:NAD-dependent deacetylase